LLPDPGSHGPDDALSGVIGTMNSSGGVADVGNINFWILGVNIIIWTGIFLYLLRLNRKLRDLEKDQ
jgi:CcmD family protein